VHAVSLYIGSEACTIPGASSASDSASSE
jgi:hypothetical protein